MREEPSPLALYEVLRDLVKVRQGPEWTKGYEIYCYLEVFKYNRALGVNENVAALKLLFDSLNNL